ncbi:hypothetical protein LTR56_010193 [Elasticomyces elasticus]|nr:hypothetical protein LTR22_017257 [Elasticomyces elasticus]KAK3643455.1 hypothetical protein LTR56_010193 [Elasticomyces elasticus]KAK4925337.1 hypothetical protein LTR49_007635 [Elasticomyces elasticus]KAK5761292.1 hypothetical protein LTS12_008568 [Elasticomyces elasticus]
MAYPYVLGQASPAAAIHEHLLQQHHQFVPHFAEQPRTITFGPLSSPTTAQAPPQLRFPNVPPQIDPYQAHGYRSAPGLPSPLRKRFAPHATTFEDPSMQTRQAAHVQGGVNMAGPMSTTEPLPGGVNVGAAAMDSSRNGAHITARMTPGTANNSIIADRIKLNRRAATKAYGPEGLPPPTPSLSGSEERVILPAKGPTGVQKTVAPKRALSQTASAIKARAQRAARKGNAQQPSPPVSTSEQPVMSTDLRRKVLGAVSRSLEQADSTTVITPAKRGSTPNGQDSRRSKRLRSMTVPSYLDDSSHTSSASPHAAIPASAMADNDVPGDAELDPEEDDVLHDNITGASIQASHERESSASSKAALPVRSQRPISAKALADLNRYSKPKDGLDWRDTDDPAERRRRRGVIASRKHAAKKSAKSRKPKRIVDDLESGGDDDSAEPEVAAENEADEDEAVPFDMAEPDGVGEKNIDFTSGDFADEDFVEDLKAILYKIGKSKSKTFFANQCRRIGTLLSIATPPKSGELLHAYTHAQAAAAVQANVYFDGPLITHNQQPMPLQTQQQFFEEYYDDDIDVFVQNPSAPVPKKEPRVQKIKLATVKTRFSKPVPANSPPWNMLELAAHRDDGFRPPFLNNEDCSLLNKVKLPSSGDTANRLGYTEGYKEVSLWTLCAQAGALTEPHQDSHGYSTYITINQGIVGFGFLSQPTEEEREAWSRNHDRYIGGRWRYIVLRPGMTVYFPAATIHTVFRHPKAGNTLAFGGHVLRCSQIVRWMKVLLAEQVNEFITNEALSVSAPGYISRVEKFVKQALRDGKEEKWGGKDAIEEFLSLKQDFEAKAVEIAKALRKKSKHG